MTEEQQPRDWQEILYHARGWFAVVLAFAVLFGGGWFVYDKVHDAYVEFTTPDDDFTGEGGETIEVVIPRGATVTKMGDILYEAGVVKSVKKFRRVVQKSGRSDELKFGRFVLKKELPAETALEMLLDPANEKRIRITFPEGTTVQEQHAKISTELGIDPAKLSAVVQNPSKLELPEWAENSGVEGFLFPSTYDVEEPIDVTAVLKKQVGQFKSIATKLDLEGRAEKLKMTPMEVLTVASIIEGEVHDPDYQPLVAAVIYNRLEEDMKLEMDSTVHYVVGKTGGVTTTAEQRKSDSPYNTYANQGLPPGPINNPGETAIKAALSPADSEALFFVTVDLETGETLFAEEYKQHEENVKKFQQYCKDNPGKCTGR